MHNDICSTSAPFNRKKRHDWFSNLIVPEKPGHFQGSTRCSSLHYTHRNYQKAKGCGDHL